MKLSNLLLFAGSAVGSYLLVKNREVITEEVIDTTDRVEAIKGDLDVIQNSLQIINQQKEVIKEYQEDLTYKFKVLEKDLQTRLAVIKELRETEENLKESIQLSLYPLKSILDYQLLTEKGGTKHETVFKSHLDYFWLLLSFCNPSFSTCGQSFQGLIK